MTCIVSDPNSFALRSFALPEKKNILRKVYKVKLLCVVKGLNQRKHWKGHGWQWWFGRWALTHPSSLRRGKGAALSRVKDQMTAQMWNQRECGVLRHLYPFRDSWRGNGVFQCGCNGGSEGRSESNHHLNTFHLSMRYFLTEARYKLAELSW